MQQRTRNPNFMLFRHWLPLLLMMLTVPPAWAQTAADQRERADGRTAKVEAERAAEASAHDANWAVPIAHDTGLMFGMRLSEAVLWPEPFATRDPGTILRHYEAAYTKPPLWDGSQGAFEWDGDAWYLNVVGHGLFGSELYMRARACRHHFAAAIGFAVAGSTLWEYVVEASGVRPSALDLVYTPLSGAALGELRYIAWRGAKQIEDSFWRTFVQMLVDPFGELERGLGAPC